MATRKKKSKVRAKAKVSTKKVSKKKVVAKKAVARKQAAPKKKVVAKKPAPAPKKARPVFEETSTQQLAFAEIIGDIEERMALDRLNETK